MSGLGRQGRRQCHPSPRQLQHQPWSRLAASSYTRTQFFSARMSGLGRRGRRRCHPSLLQLQHQPWSRLAACSCMRTPGSWQRMYRRGVCEPWRPWCHICQQRLQSSPAAASRCARRLGCWHVHKSPAQSAAAGPNAGRCMPHNPERSSLAPSNGQEQVIMEGHHTPLCLMPWNHHWRAALI